MLRYGSRGNEVYRLQRRLAELGFNPGPIDGIFGPKTKAAVLAFQRAAGIQVDGIVGPQTWGALATYGGSGGGDSSGGDPRGDLPPDAPSPSDPVAPPPLPPGDDPDIIDDIPEPPIDPPAVPPPVAPGPNDIVGQTGLTFLQHTNLLLPWLPQELAAVFAQSWAETGSSDLALAAVRTSDLYDQWLPGNRRPDGTVRNTEAEYFARVDAYNRSLASINLNPTIFEPQYTALIEGEVSANEFRNRVNASYTEIVQNLPSVREWFAEQYDIALTDEGIVASFLSPEIGEAILNRRILSSQIGGTAALRGFDLGLDQAGRLAAAGLNQRSSQEFFSQAARFIPTLSTLAERFRDPDQSFDVDEFIEANIFGDPEQARRMERLFARESASFFNEGNQVARSQRIGSLTGLRRR